MRNQVLTPWILAVGCAAPMACAATVYTNSFDAAPGAEWSGVTTTAGVQRFASLGFSGNMLRNAANGNPAAATRLTLTGLGAHSSVSISFLLAVIDSWDGNGDGDSFTVRVGDGITMNTVFFETFTNDNEFGMSYTGTSLSGITGPQSRTNLGFTSFFGDDAYDMGASLAGLQNIAHTSSTLVVEFYAGAGGNNWRGGNDESWGMDNLAITTVPLPTAGGLGMAGLGLLAVRRRRRSAI